MRLIDADALLDYIDVGHLRSPLEICFSERNVANMVNRMPTIDAVEVVHGRWAKNYDGDNIVYCDQCYMPQDMQTPYCHSCGAKMDGERKTNEKK